MTSFLDKIERGLKKGERLYKTVKVDSYKHDTILVIGDERKGTVYLQPYQSTPVTSGGRTYPAGYRGGRITFDVDSLITLIEEGLMDFAKSIKEASRTAPKLTADDIISLNDLRAILARGDVNVLATLIGAGSIGEQKESAAYTCSICGKSYKSKAWYDRHMSTHDK